MHNRSPGLLALALLFLAGCRATTPLPTYPITDGPTSLHLIADRLATVKSIQSTASVELDDGHGHHIILDAAMAAQPPGNLHLRAWKLDRAIFDATIRDGELWMVPPDNPEDQARFADADRVAAGIRRAFDLLGPRFFESAAVIEDRSSDDRLIAAGTIDDLPITATIDRPTLTARKFELSDTSQPTPTPVLIKLDDYRDINGVAWPTRIAVDRRDADNKPAGRVVIRLHDVELNGPIQPAAFVPPRRAVRRP